MVVLSARSAKINRISAPLSHARRRTHTAVSHFKNLAFALLTYRFVVSMKEVAGQNGKPYRFEEIFNLCSDYEREIEKDDFNKSSSSSMFHHQHQFGAISFYTTATANAAAVATNNGGTMWSPVSTLTHKR